MMKKLWELFWVFAKMGVMTFGGGYAMLPILQREIVETRAWATEEEMADYYAVGQCTPGIIAVNVATFIGRRQAGLPGAIVASLGQVFPCLVIISIVASVLSDFAEYAIVQDAFAGIRACVCVLILNAVIKLFKNAVVDQATLILFIGILLGAVFLNLSPMLFVLLSGVVGMVLHLLHLDGKAEKEDGK